MFFLFEIQQVKNRELERMIQGARPLQEVKVPLITYNTQFHFPHDTSHAMKSLSKPWLLTVKKCVSKIIKNVKFKCWPFFVTKNDIFLFCNFLHKMLKKNVLQLFFALDPSKLISCHNEWQHCQKINIQSFQKWYQFSNQPLFVTKNCISLFFIFFHMKWRFK